MTKLASEQASVSEVRSDLGTVVGRLSLDEFCFRTDGGWTLSVRVPRSVATNLAIGQRAVIVVGRDGRPESLRQVEGGAR